MPNKLDFHDARFHRSSNAFTFALDILRVIERLIDKRPSSHLLRVMKRIKEGMDLTSRCFIKSLLRSR